MNWSSDTEPKIVSEKGVEMGLVGLAQEITFRPGVKFLE